MRELFREMSLAAVRTRERNAIPEIKRMEVKFERSNIRQTVGDAIIGLSLILVARIGVGKDREAL